MSRFLHLSAINISRFLHLSAIIGWCKYTHIRDYIQEKASFLISFNFKNKMITIRKIIILVIE
ncbi:hypothetical protein [Segatella copri]|uniref:hypothetical protein n=1 Tax=Segatella copri TaxID=165179 RepID=UPI0034608A4B